MILKLSMLVSWAVLTMTAQEPVRPNLDGFTYPTLAQAARVQGAVQFVVNSDGLQLLAGHPFLVPAARSNLDKWATPDTFGKPLSVTYVFRLAEPTTRSVEVDQPIGDGFDRFFLRLFHRPLTRRVKEQNCIDSDDSSIGFKNLIKDGLQSIEIEIGAVTRCVHPQFVAMSVLWH
jgi:hypothetical protein